MGMHVTVYMWRSEDNLQELVLSFPYVGLGDLKQAFRLGRKKVPSPTRPHSRYLLKVNEASKGTRGCVTFTQMTASVVAVQGVPGRVRFQISGSQPS